MQNQHVLNRYSLAGLGATLIGNGIGRFAYIALMPALIQAGWFDESQASYLGAATLIGYIFGAPVIGLLTKRFSNGVLIKAAMLVSSFTYLGCAIEHAPIAWYYMLRTLAGISGAMLIILAPPIVVRMHTPAIRARISGIIFSGIGLGALLSGTLVPLLIYHSIVSAWLGMGIVALVTTFLTWNAWSTQSEQQAAGVVNASFANLSNVQRITVILILIAYSLDAIGYLPHTMFWVDYVVRELEMPLFTGGLLWASFGFGAMIGPLLAGVIGDKFGIRRSLVVSFMCKSAGVALPVISQYPTALFISALLVGIFTPGTVSLVSIYVLESVGYELHTKAWGMMTMAFALSQGIAGYLMAYLAPMLSSYNVLFSTSAGVLMISACLIAISPTPIREPFPEGDALQTKD
ncbi:YbfB/YjiJ family MFS transporter [Vibrio hepatarius]|uniref:YbfB/YjiJ family MFS transporter n=1 Tax=Vibrio hepatarius TaxID=171383 RepID=UPI00142DC2E0|nr:YbfB/YjiJ family MFS transporter [Vibrio hepatarius]NIY82039.1 YbfB/YjiJ family MFS transporter [Vibrio hepatarius]